MLYFCMLAEPNLVWLSQEDIHELFSNDEELFSHVINADDEEEWLCFFVEEATHSTHSMAACWNYLRKLQQRHGQNIPHMFVTIPNDQGRGKKGKCEVLTERREERKLARVEAEKQKNRLRIDVTVV